MKRWLLGFLFLAALGQAQTPSVPAGAVLNAASNARGQVVTPGSLVSIYGTELAGGLSQADTIPLSTSLGGVSVTFNDIPAPLLFVSQGQVNAQLPWNVLGGAASGTATVVVRRGSATSAPQQVQVGPFSPGVFTLQFGTGPAIAINSDGSIAAAAGSIPGFPTQPAPIGSTIVILGTGLGAVDTPVADGANSLDALRRNTTTPVVLIGGIESKVVFSGLSPQFVGVNQLNVEIPDGVTPGNAVPLQIRVGSITTTDQATIAVRAR